ncbi:MAG: hypothetical protein K8Q91_01235 [Candidatus Vogelbacteria bacterium]|nr:hypothetical protein [Candidatus Vogelbacteria bacterium]
MNDNDLIRENILKYLYKINKEASIIDRTRCNERQIFLNLQEKHSRPEVVSNLDYLIKTGWVKLEKINKLPYYSISDKGINHFEGSSFFQKSHWVTGININNIQGVTVIGDHNFVHQEFGDLYKNLDLLKEEVTKSGTISDEDKLDYQSEIETIKSQLAKKEPNKNIIKQAWAGLSVLSTLEGVVQFYQMAEEYIEPFLT